MVYRDVVLVGSVLMLSLTIDRALLYLGVGTVVLLGLMFGFGDGVVADVGLGMMS